MKNSPTDYMPQLDWDGLHFARTFDGPFDPRVLIPGCGRLSLRRDDDYNIVGSAYGYTKEPNPTSCHFPDMGRPQDIELKLNYATVEITHCVYNSVTSAPPQSPGRHVGLDMEAPFTARSVRLHNIIPKTPRFSLREWYLNAPPDNHYFRHRVDRRKTAIYEHRRTGRDSVADRFEMLQYSQASIGCIMLKVGPFRFLMEYVPESFSPWWSHKLMIEYRDEWGLVPDPDTRSRVADIAGYLLGRELIPIGSTELNAEGFAVASTYLSHLRPNIRQLCKHHPRYPLDLGESTDAFEAAFTKAYVAYENRHPTLPIAECLRRYWLAVDQPPGMNIVILATTLELLSNAWFESRESRSHGTYMTLDAYRALLAPEIDSLTLKLDGVEGGKAVLRRILSAYHVSSNDHSEVFFEELGLPLSDKAKKTLRERNRYVHGGRIDVAEAGQIWGRYAGLFTSAMSRLLGIQ